MPHIQTLDPHVADLIAAGEVVERPASVVKELMENAIDAGALQVTVEIQRGGMSYIRVTDNGCGIAPEEAETAFLRHATSKIRSEYDLEAIGTLGFRGEALAAIAAVSHIELLTRRAEDDFGTSLLLDAGVLRIREEAGGPVGTTMIVRDLFFNTPARLKFMKRDAAEGAAVYAVVQHTALSHPEVSVRFLKDGKQELQTPGDCKTQSALYAVLGRDIALGFKPIKGSGENLTVEGYVSLPTCCRGTRGYQHFFVNGRYVKSRTMTAALEEAYKNQKMVGKFPGCVLYVTAKLNAVDVNVHPTKTEVKFTSEKALFDGVYHTIRAALEEDHTRPQVTLPTPAEKPTAAKSAPPSPAPVRPGASAPLERPAASASIVNRGKRPLPGHENFFRSMTAEEYRQSAATAPSKPEPTPAPAPEPAPESKSWITQLQDSGAPVYRPLSQAPRHPVSRLEQEPPQADFLPEWGASPVASAVEPPPEPEQIPPPEPTPEPEQAPPPIIPPAPPEPMVQEAILPEVSPKQPEDAPQEPADWRLVGEVFHTYILVEQGDTMLLIDKHAAHERMNFDRLKAADYRPMAQQLLAPVVFTPQGEEGTVLLQNRALLEEFAFDVEDFGGGALIVRQVPYDIDAEETESTLTQLAEKLLVAGTADPASARDDLLHTIACKAAIKGGQKNGAEELLRVTEAVMRGEVKYCPHGRPVAIELTRKQLEKQFKRA